MTFHLFIKTERSVSTVLCSRASFVLYRSDGSLFRNIRAREEFAVWYVEPDGSNLDGVLDQLSDTVSSVEDDWFDLVDEIEWSDGRTE